VVIRDLRGVIVAANGAYARLTTGQPGPHGLAAAPERLMEASHGGRWLSWSETEMTIEGRPHRLLSGRDVTDSVRQRRGLEEDRTRALSESEAKSRLLATVSHEFRTPLNGILGMTRLLLETPLDLEQRTYAQAVQSSAEAFLRLVEDVLHLSCIEAGRLELSDEPFDLGALVQGIVELLAPRAQGKGTDIAAFVARDVPALVQGDPDRLRQVLFNLAGNAVKFTRMGGIGVRVDRGAGDLIRIMVEDTGPGISPERAVEIFDEFETGDWAPPGEPGAGLGLAITRRLVTRMGGTVTLASELGRGACFTVELPLPAAADPNPAERDEAAAGPRGPVLILSGSPFSGRYLARTLDQAGIAAEVAGSLGEALDRMAARRFAALLADHALPDDDVRVAAREAHRHGIGRTVVLLSPFERRDFGSPHAAGFDAYLIKPVRPCSLFEQIEPGARAAAPAPARRGPVAGAPRPLPLSRRAPRVLLAEDNEINALLAVTTLERLGAVVDWAADGQQAWDRAEAALRGDALPFDLVLLDMRMPGLDGPEVARRIRAWELQGGGSGRRSRVVALTAGEPGREGARPVPPGVDALLLKPFTVEALQSELDRLDAPVAYADAS
jgi:signal transduction histidine kinase/CheY-like chemotaxis protein